jgi:hypothetical protein
MAITNSTISDIKNAGKDKIEEKFTYFAVGDGDTTPTIADTELENETFRVARFEVDKDTFPDEITVTAEVGYGDNNGEVIREVGWLDASSGGNLKVRNVLVNEIIKTNDISVIFPNRITFDVYEA